MLKWFRRPKEEAPETPVAQDEIQIAEGMVEADTEFEPVEAEVDVQAADLAGQPPEEAELSEEYREFKTESIETDVESVLDEMDKLFAPEEEAFGEQVTEEPTEEASEEEFDFDTVTDFGKEMGIEAPGIKAEPEFEVEAEPEIETAAPEKKKGFFIRLRERLSKTKRSMIGALRSAIRLHGKIDEDLLEEIEDILIQSDVGVQTTMKIVETLRKEAREQPDLEGEAVMEILRDQITRILTENQRPLNLAQAHPTIILMVGVNGTGKTTTIGKIGKVLADHGRNVMMVAADTFRAGAADQLQVWAERTGSAIVRREEGADPASVVYEALEGAQRGPIKPDVILIDTAGRLHTKINLMEQLKKMVRVIERHYPDAPHETIIVLDATTGQNAVNQVKIFHEACDLSGMIMTKLDGTAKGGILIACKDLYDLPIFKIGIGESAEDLRDFEATEFVEALFSANGEATGDEEESI